MHHRVPPLCFKYSMNNRDHRSCWSSLFLLASIQAGEEERRIFVYFLLGISPASNCSWPTFRNPVSVPSSFEDGTDTGFRNVGQLQFDAGEIPRKNIQYSNHGESLKSRHFSLLQNVQTCSGAHPTSYSVGSGVFYSGVIEARA